MTFIQRHINVDVSTFIQRRINVDAVMIFLSHDRQVIQ